MNLIRSILYLLGSILFGIATIQGGVSPSIAEMMLIVGVPLGANGVFMAQHLRTIGAILAGSALIWMGLNMRGAMRNEFSE